MDKTTQSAMKSPERRYLVAYLCTGLLVVIIKLLNFFNSNKHSLPPIYSIKHLLLERIITLNTLNIK